MIEFDIQSHLRKYLVRTFSSLKEAIQSSSEGSDPFVLIDEQVAQLYAGQIDSSCNPDRMIKIKASEELKSYQNLEPLFVSLIEKGLNKKSKLLVIGGGVTQDIGCFIASTYSRGIQWDFIPTTLLAQCDSCIGSKSSLNIGRFKNQLGTFYPPHKVSIVFSVLNTLAESDIHSGIGEIIKLALIEGGEDLAETKKDLKAWKDSPADKELALSKMISRSLQIKKRYIEQDEFDQGIRNVLNYGHTFGHAYESATQYAIPHGIAVLLGMSTATYFSEKLGMVPNGSYQELDSWIQDLYTPFQKHLQPTRIEEILKAMKTDKKNSNGKISCILTRGPSKMERAPLNLDEDVRPLMTSFLKQLGSF